VAGDGVWRGLATEATVTCPYPYTHVSTHTYARIQTHGMGTPEHEGAGDNDRRLHV